MNQDTLIFLHISKTGGTTLRSIIQKQYQAERIYDIDPPYFVSDPALYQEVITEHISKLDALIRCIFYPRAIALCEYAQSHYCR